MIYLLDPSQATRAIALAWQADTIARELKLPFRVPCCLVGGYGSGKTEAVREFHRMVNDRLPEFRYWSVNLSMKESSEVGGIPVPTDTGSFRYLTPPEMPFDDERLVGVQFADEIDRATPETLNAYMQILLGGEVHGHKVATNVYQVAAMNGATDIYTTPLSGACRTRLCFIYVGGASNDAYAAWSKDKGIPETIRQFRRVSPEMMHGTDDKIEELSYCVPRTLDMAGMVLLAAERVKFRTDDVLTACVAGCVGRAASVKLLSMDRIVRAVPEYEKVLADPEGAAVPTDLAVLNSVRRGYVERVTSRVDGKLLAMWIRRFPDEARASWVHEFARLRPQFAPDWVIEAGAK